MDNRNLQQSYTGLMGDDRQSKRQEIIKANPQSSLFRADKIPDLEKKPVKVNQKQEDIEPENFSDECFSSDDIYFGDDICFLGKIESDNKISGKSSSSIIRNIRLFNKNAFEELTKEAVFNNLQETLRAIVEKELTYQETFAQLDLLYRQLKKVECGEELLSDCEDLVRYAKAQLFCLEEIERKLLDDGLFDLDAFPKTMARLKEQYLLASAELSEEKSWDHLIRGAREDKKTFFESKIKNYKKNYKDKKNINNKMDCAARSINRCIKEIYELMEENDIVIDSEFKKSLVDNKIIKKSLQPLFSPSFASALSENSPVAVSPSLSFFARTNTSDERPAVSSPANPNKRQRKTPDQGPFIKK